MRLPSSPRAECLLVVRESVAAADVRRSTVLMQATCGTQCVYLLVELLHFFFVSRFLPLLREARPHQAPYVDGSLRIRDPALFLLRPGNCVPSELSIVACDFGLLAPRPGLPSLSQCSGTFRVTQRQRPLCGSAGDSHDQHRFREAMLAQTGGSSLNLGA
jgi:hypothetical protein